MTVNHQLKLWIFVMMLLASLQLSAQTSACKDTVKHHRLQSAMWEAAAGTDPQKVADAAIAFQKHTDSEGDLEGHYNAWMCGIAFNLDRMNLRDAYHLAIMLKNDLKNETGGQEEQYMGPMMMGQVYNVCGNVDGAISELKDAIELIKGTRYEENTLHSLYVALAHLMMTSDLDESMKWIDEEMEVLNEHKTSSGYKRGMGGACAFKSIIYFKKKDYKNYRYWYDQIMAYNGGAPDGYSGLFMQYTNIYKKALDGHVWDALKSTDSIKSVKDSYLMKIDLYAFAGDMQKAYDTQRELMLKSDSIAGAMMADNIQQVEQEIELFRSQQRMAKVMNIVLSVGVVLALIIILLLIRNYFIRRRYQQRLLSKNRELRKANEHVMAVDEMKTEFIRSMSHEIRTPLNIINGFSQLLTDEESELEASERKSIAKTINESTRQITSLVNKMQALVNMTTDDILNRVVKTNALDVCQKAILMMPYVDPQQINLIFENKIKDGNTVFATNADSLLQMLGNILENAVKFTERGYIRLTLSRDKTHFHFMVEDTGCGIPEDKVSTIFERFTKVDEFKEGLGLGLAYCYETAQKLGGTLRMDHTSEKGTTFVLSLPIKLKSKIKK